MIVCNTFVPAKPTRANFAPYAAALRNAEPEDQQGNSLSMLNRRMAQIPKMFAMVRQKARNVHRDNLAVKTVAAQYYTDFG